MHGIDGMIVTENGNAIIIELENMNRRTIAMVGGGIARRVLARNLKAKRTLETTGDANGKKAGAKRTRRHVVHVGLHSVR